VKRILTALVLIPLFVLAVMAKNPLYFQALIMAAGVLCAAELERIASASGMTPFAFLGSLWALGFLASASWPDAVHLDVVLAAGFLALLAWGLWGRVGMPQVLASAGLSLFTAGYAGYLLGFLITLKGLGEPFGAKLIFLMVIVVWTGDSAAYYVGSTVGKHKLAPLISPKKTWEGAVADVAGGMLGAAVAHWTFFPDLAWPHVIALGIALSVVAQLGDAFESVLKRGAGVKDSGSLLPGHGGVLDRLDSLFFNGPLLFYYYQAFLR